MSNEPNTSDEHSEIRHNLVDTATNFLLNPAVSDKPSIHKTAFLKKKGLSDAEISLAFQKAESDPKYLAQQKNNSENISVLPPPIPAYSRSVPIWSRVRHVTSSLVVLGAALFGAHYVYKKYIEPFIFGGDSKKDTAIQIEHLLLQTTKSLTELEKKLTALEERVECQNSQIDRFFHNENNYYATPLALSELKTEIGSVKSLLLNRHQFPALPKVSSPSIPEWQLAKENQNASKENDESEQTKDYSSSPEALTSSEDSFVRVGPAAKENTLNDDETSAQSEYFAT